MHRINAAAKFADFVLRVFISIHQEPNLRQTNRTKRPKVRDAAQASMRTEFFDENVLCSQQTDMAIIRVLLEEQPAILDLAGLITRSNSSCKKIGLVIRNEPYSERNRFQIPTGADAGKR